MSLRRPPAAPRATVPGRRLRAAAVAVAIALLALPAHDATALVPIPAGATWSADLATHDFTQWSWWGQDQQDRWGHISVVDARAAGMPPLTPGIPNVARMAVTRSDAASGSYHAKLYKQFSRRTSSGVERPPRTVSGTYSAWFFIPRSYAITKGAWTNILQFKEVYKHGSAGERSDPLWWVQLNSAGWARRYRGPKRWLGDAPRRDRAPVALVNHWDNRWRRTVKLMPVPLGRWFEIRAVVRQGERIAFFLDGRALDTVPASEHPVSPFHADSRGWIFGVGNYSKAPDTVLYMTAASYTPRSPAAPSASAACWFASSTTCPGGTPSAAPHASAP